MGIYYLAAGVLAALVLIGVAVDLWLLTREDNLLSLARETSRWDDENPDDAMNRVLDR